MKFKKKKKVTEGLTSRFKTLEKSTNLKRGWQKVSRLKQNRQKRRKKKKRAIQDVQDNNKISTIPITGVQEGQKEWGRENMDNIMAENFLEWMKLNPISKRPGKTLV